MKIRALGTGSSYSRHPLVSSSFLVQSEAAVVVFGCGAGIPAKLEAINIAPDRVDIWVPLHMGSDQIAGLEEIGHKVLSQEYSSKPYVACPAPLAAAVEERLRSRFHGHCPLHMKPTKKIHIQEEHLEEVVTFVPNYGTMEGYGLHFEESEIFISGDTELNDEWLHNNGSAAKLIFHACRLGGPTGLPGQNPLPAELQELPVYLQQKIWLYGYENSYQSEIDPLPMLFLPQGAWIYDSDRKDKHLEKERFIRESSKRQIGNQRAAKN